MKDLYELKSVLFNSLFLPILSVIFTYGNLCIPNVAFAGQGIHGAKTVSTANVIVNEFTTLTVDAVSGATSMTVAKSYLDANIRFSDSLKAGELVMIIQMQGAGMTTAGLANSSAWGDVSSSNNSGLFEVDEVAAVPNGTTITLVTPLKNSYTSSGNVQVVRVPRYTTLTVNAGASITTDTWNGTYGGILAIETNGIVTINGTIDVSGKGFRGGAIDNASGNGNTVYTIYAATDSSNGAEKGEGTGGYRAIYDALGGRYGRGAATNGGGGGNSHNAGGGGGANAGNIASWNGLGNPDTSVAAWITAWDLESANFHKNFSSGGGRGGYSYGMKSRNPLTDAPGDHMWGGNDRSNTGGYGGRPLDNSSGHRIYFGGGGGAGDSNNGTGTPGANGGGIVYLISSGDVNGTGTVNANGADAATSESPSNGDGTGGAGGGGSVVIFTNCAAVNNIGINAKGGKGGDQNDYGSSESEGPGGGGGGGYISTTNSNALNISVSGGMNGTSNSGAVTTFTPNGATKGAAGTVTLVPPTPYSDTTIVLSPTISVLPASPSLCAGQSVSLTASGGTTYSWSPSNGLSASTGTSITANPSGTTTYTVIGTNGGGCSSLTNIKVIVNPLPSLAILPASPSICNGQSVTLTVGGAALYSWSPNSGLSGSTGSSVTANPSSTLIYAVTGTDSNGCSNASNVTVTVNPLPSVGVLPASPTVCSGQSVSLSGNGGNAYSWTPSTGLSATTGASVNANPTTTSTYVVTGTDGNGCSSSASATVNVNPAPTVSVTPASPSICNGQSVALNASGGSTSYSWNPSSGLSAATGSSVNANPSSTSTFTVTGTGANGCTNTKSVTVTVSAIPSVGVLPATPSICFGKSVALNASGGSAYSWSPSSGLSASTGSSVSASPTSTSTYTVTGTNGAGCSNTASVMVTVNLLPAVGVLPASPSLCAGQSVSLTASGGNTYTWSPASGLSASSGASVNANPSSTSTYIVTGTDGNGCTNTSSTTLAVNPLPSIAVLPSSPSICSGRSVSLNASGGSSYSWSPSGGLSGTTGASVTANPPSTSSYTITGTDANGCSNTARLTLTVNPLPTVAVLPATPEICNGQSVTLNAGGGSTYVWSPASGLSGTTGVSVSANPDTTSSYIVTGTDANGCSNTATATATVHELPLINVPASPALCAGQSVTLNASGGSTYDWSPASGLSAVTGSGVNADPSSTSSYIVTGTDGNGCSNTASVTITVNPLPVVLVNPANPVICNGQSVSLWASGANTYSWSPSSGLSASTGSSVTASPPATSSYVVMGTDANGCTNTANLTVTVLSSLTITVSPTTPAICNGQSASLTASGANAFTWSPSSGLSATSGSAVNANPSSTTTYKVVGAAGGCSDSANVTVTVNALPSVGVLPLTPAICFGETVSLAASGGNSYSWSPASGLSAATGDSVNADPGATSTYIVTGTDGHGCSNTSSVTVTVYPLPAVGVLPASPAICAGNSVSLTASGGTTYVWSPASGLSAATGTSVSADPSATSSYIVTGTDGNGCYNTSSVMVTVNSLPAIGILPASPAICFGGSVSLTASGGNTYDWSPASGLSAASGTSVNANPSATVSYIVTGTDGNGCSNTSSVTVSVNALPVIDVLPASPAVCAGSFVALTASGANSYSWSPTPGLSATTGTSVNAGPAGTSAYIVTGTDGNGCTNTSSVTVTVNPLPVISAGPDLSVCSGDSAQLSITGDPLSSTYLWSPSAGLNCTTCKNPEAIPLASTDYIISVTDPSGCVGVDTVGVHVQSFSITASPDTTICAGSFVQLNATGGSSYQWFPTAGLTDSIIANPRAYVFSNTTYTVSVTSGSCSSNAVVNIAVFPAPIAPNLTQSHDTLYCSSDPSYVSYQWYFNSVPIPGADSLYYVGKQSGNYNVAITDNNGCSISVGINIIITGIAPNQFSNYLIYLFPDPAHDYVFVHAATFSAGKSVSVNVSNALGEEIITQSTGQEWNGQIDIKSLAAGIYFIRLHNENGNWVGKFVKN